jgi:antitoxin YefM
MNHINLKEPNPTLANLIDQVNQDQQATLITINEQKQAVLVSLEEWNGLQETLYLSSIPGVKDDLIVGKNTSWEDCVPLDQVEW